MYITQERPVDEATLSIQPPVLLAYTPDPTNDTTPTLDWIGLPPIPSAYHIQIDDNADFSSPIIDESPLTDSTYTLVSALPEGIIYWRVSSIDVDGNETEYSQTDSFTIDVTPPVIPILIPYSPDPTYDVMLTLDWNDVADAGKYHIQIADNADFNNFIIDDSSLTESVYIPNFLLPEGKIYWRVSSIDGAGNESDFSDTDDFTVEYVSSPPATGSWDVYNHYDAAVFSDGMVDIRYSIISNVEGDMFSNQIINLNSYSIVNVQGTIAAGEQIEICNGCTLNADKIEEGIEKQQMPQLDFEQYKEKADAIYTSQDFASLLENSSPLILNGIIYVIGDIHIQQGQSLTVNGFLVSDGTIEMGEAMSALPSYLTINQNNGPSGLAAKNITALKKSHLDIEGLVYCSGQLYTYRVTQFDVLGGIISNSIIFFSQQIEETFNIHFYRNLILQAQPQNTTPPTPNTIASIVAISATQIDLTSTEATDDMPPVYYSLDGQYYDSASWGDSSGGVSNYDYSQTRPNPWSDTNLVENGWYRHRQRVKDSATPPNESAWSDWVEKATLLNPPQDSEITFANVTATGMNMTVATPPKPSGAGSTAAYFDLITGQGQGSGVTDRGYADDYTAEYTNLTPNTQYGWKVKYRNRDGIETAYNPTEQKRYTLANTPSAPTVSNPTETTLNVTIDANGNPDYTLFTIYNVTGGYYINASGGNNGDTEVWQTKSDWGTVTVVNLTSGTTYEFKCKAKNGDGIETPLGPSGSGTTTSLPTPDISVNPSSLNFGQVARNHSANQFLTISNKGDIDLEVTNITTNKPDFSVYEPSEVQYLWVVSSQRYWVKKTSY